MERNTPEKDLRIETIRGLALLLMVAGHVIGDTATAGMQVSEDSFLRYLYDSLVYVRMPLFTAISGYVYALRPLGPQSALWRFQQGKLRRIVLPMVVVSTLFFISQMIAPGANAKSEWAEMYNIYIYGYSHFWFLQAIFCIFLMISLLDKFECLNTLPKALIGIALATLASLNYEAFPDLFSFKSGIHLLPFFMLGLSVYRFSGHLSQMPIQLTMFAVLIVTVAMNQSYLWDHADFSEGEIALIGTALGLAAIYLLIVRRFYFAPLAWLGRYSFEIYLLHVFGTAGTRIALGKLGVQNDSVIFFCCLLVGLALPVAVKLVAGRIPLADLMLFGAKPARKSTVRQPRTTFKARESTR